MMADPCIHPVIASAGAGKTTRIVQEVAAEVMAREPETIVATTFTVRAADELIERSRAYLFRNGQAEQASRLLGARFGTINSICGQIVAEYAIDLGRSPATEVIAEGSVTHVFTLAADAAIERHAPSLNRLAESFGYFEPRFGGGSTDWRGSVQRIVELARANGMGAGLLSTSARRSVEGFTALLPPIAADAEVIDSELERAIKQAVSAIPSDPSVAAKKSIPLLRATNAALRRGDALSWPDWARLSKADCAQKDGLAFGDALRAVRQWAARHCEHPRLRAECTEFIQTLFICAAEAFEAYQNHKSERGLLDFIDQETLALDVLKNPVTRARLGERIGRVFVDEFQDSSPLQIAIFTALAEIVEASTWVGDPKQAIYGFRNADSALTQAAFQGVMAASHTPADVLSKSYRSRQTIVDLVNAAFTPAFEDMGLPKAEHAFTGTARTEDGLTHGALGVWRLDGTVPKQTEALATGISEALAEADHWPVQGRDGDVRPLQAGDIAVLCRSNDDITNLAGALSRRGIKVAVEREGLTQTAHVQLVTAALRWTADPTDRLALAELARFFGAATDSDEWLRALGEADQEAALRAVIPISGALAALREQVLALTPSELLDAILGVADVMALVETWGDHAIRLDDLEALRGFARNYETECAGSGAPATASGLVLAIKSATPARPKSLQSDVVKVMTYHGAKGLEWPMVILTGLNRGPRPRLFDAVAEADGEVDWRDPLAGRWIRYWPWPYGQLSDDTLTLAALASETGKRASLRARDEETRLLYVGMTRPRDYLIFAPAVKAAPAWLSVLDAGTPNRLTLPTDDRSLIAVGAETFEVRNRLLVEDEPIVTGVSDPTYVSIPRSPAARAALHRRPSGEGADDRYKVVERIELGPRLPISGAPDMTRLGEAVHAILAADALEAPLALRLERASAILARWGVHEIKAEDVCGASDRLHLCLTSTWPTVRLSRETPVHARLGDQLVSGRIDLIAEHDGGYAVIDHKSFPGAREHWERRAVSYGAQLGLYAEAVAAATGRPCADLYIHMPLVGALLRVAPRAA